MAFVTIRIAVGLLRERTKREDEADPSAHAQAQRSTVHLKSQWKYAKGVLPLFDTWEYKWKKMTRSTIITAK